MGIWLLILLATVPLMAIGSGVCFFLGFKRLALGLLAGCVLAVLVNAAFYFAIVNAPM